MIKKSYLFLTLILFSSQNCSSMQPDFEFPDYLDIKRNLLEAVKKSDYDKMIKSFDSLSLNNEAFKNKFAPSGRSEEIMYFNQNIKPRYLNNLIYTPLKPNTKSVKDIAFDKKNLSILHALWEETQGGSEQAFFSYLNKDLKIDPKTDKNYLKLKDELNQAINSDDITNVQAILSNFMTNLRGNYIIIGATDAMVIRYFTNVIWPEYVKDLMENPVQLAFKKQNFGILYLLFDHIGEGYKEYLKFIEKNRAKIQPNDDPVYQKIKNQLIDSIKNANYQDVVGLLEDFDTKAQEKYWPRKQINDLPSEIRDYYRDDIKPKYLEDLYLDLIPLATNTGNSSIIYKLLDHLIHEPYDYLFKILISNNPDIAKQLLKIEDQPIYDAVDYLISTYFEIYNDNPIIFEFLNNLKEAGINSIRMDNDITKASAKAKIEPESEIIEELKEKKLLTTFNEIDYEQYKVLFKIIPLLNNLLREGKNLIQPNQYLNDLKSINIKDEYGDSLLIKATMKDWIGKKLINFIKMLIEEKKADVNQPGQAGLTPLMHTIKTRYDDLKEQIDMIKYLIEHGANPEAKDVFGKTALDYAKETNKPELIAALEAPKKTMTVEEQIITLNTLNSSLNSLANQS